MIGFVDRNIVGGNRSISGDSRSSHEAAAPSQEHHTPVLPLVSEEQKAELDRKMISILKEFIEIKDFQVCVFPSHSNVVIGYINM